MVAKQEQRTLYFSKISAKLRSSAPSEEVSEQVPTKRLFQLNSSLRPPPSVRGGRCAACIKMERKSSVGGPAIEWKSVARQAGRDERMDSNQGDIHRMT